MGQESIQTADNKTTISSFIEGIREWGVDDWITAAVVAVVVFFAARLLYNGFNPPSLRKKKH